jgi:hypothetical protein
MANAELAVAAIDVGSGMTKFVVGVFTYKDKKIIEMEKLEKPIPYGVDWKRSNDENLSAEIQEQGIQVFREINAILSKWKEQYKSKYPNIELTGVGTEVFRKAKNGEHFLKKVETETGLKIKLISQELEAKLGFLTGKAALLTIDGETLKDQFNYNEEKDLVVYDSGGGSFQITWNDRCNKFPESAGKEELNTVLQPNGLAPTLHDLLKLQNKDQQATPNPVTYQTAMTLVDKLIDKYIDPVDIEQLTTQGFDPFYLSIGGINSHVRLAADVIKHIQTEKKTKNKTENAMVTPKFYSFTEQSVTEALKRLCDKEDNQLEMFATYENAEPASYMVPKMCILLSALKGYKIPKLHWVMCCGSCFGLILNHIDEKI